MMIQECEAGMGVRLIPKPQGQVTDLVIKKPTRVIPTISSRGKTDVTVVKPLSAKTKDKFTR